MVRADVVFLKHGAKLEGHIVKRSESSVEIDIGAGSLTIPMSTVDRIEKGRSVLDDYEDRSAELGAQDRDGWLELARWASGKGLRTQSLDAYARVLTIDPNDPEANRAQGRVEVEGSWMTPEQAYAEKGYVNFEGRWSRLPSRSRSCAPARPRPQQRPGTNRRSAGAGGRGPGAGGSGELRAVDLGRPPLLEWLGPRSKNLADEPTRSRAVGGQRHTGATMSVHEKSVTLLLGLALAVASPGSVWAETLDV